MTEDHADHRHLERILVCRRKPKSYSLSAMLPASRLGWFNAQPRLQLRLVLWFSFKFQFSIHCSVCNVCLTWLSGMVWWCFARIPACTEANKGTVTWKAHLKIWSCWLGIRNTEIPCPSLFHGICDAISIPVVSSNQTTTGVKQKSRYKNLLLWASLPISWPYVRGMIWAIAVVLYLLMSVCMHNSNVCVCVWITACIDWIGLW